MNTLVFAQAFGAEIRRREAALARCPRPVGYGAVEFSMGSLARGLYHARWNRGMTFGALVFYAGMAPTYFDDDVAELRQMEGGFYNYQRKRWEYRSNRYYDRTPLRVGKVQRQLLVNAAKVLDYPLTLILAGQVPELKYQWNARNPRARGDRCFYHPWTNCGGGGVTTEHVIPRTPYHGPNLGWNLVPCCESCNSSKGNKLLDEWRQHLGLPEHAHNLLSFSDGEEYSQHVYLERYRDRLRLYDPKNDYRDCEDAA